MNMKNNHIRYILGLVCVVTMLSACSRIANLGKPSDEFTKPEISIEQTSTDESFKADISKEETIEQETSTQSHEDTEHEDMKLLSLSTSGFYDSDYDYTLNKYLYHVEVQTLHINDKSLYGDSQRTAEDCPELYTALEAFDVNQTQQAIYWRDSIQEDIKTDLESRETDDFFSYSYETKILTQRSDDNVLSFLYKTYTYQNGAHGFTMHVGYNFDTQTGKSIELTDVILDTDKLSTLLHDKLVKEYNDMLFGDPKETVNTMIADNTLYWTLGYEGITCYFNQYDIAPYSAGMLSVHLGFADYPELFNKRYMDIPDRYAFQMSDYDVYHIDVDDDGTEESVMMYYIDDEYGTTSSLVLSVDDKSVSTDCFCYLTTCMYIHMPNGKNYIYINASEDNDYQSIYVYEINKNPKLIDRVTNLGLASLYNKKMDCSYQLVITDPDMFRLKSSGNLICTGSLYKTYNVGDDGMPQSDDEEYRFIDDAYQITSKISLTLTDTDGQSTELPAGTVFDVLSTDNETYAKLGFGSKIYKLPIEKSDGETWYRKVEGKNLEDVFDGIFFGG